MRENSETAERMKSVRAIMVDVDGALCNGQLVFGQNGEGETYKVFSLRDEAGARLARAAGLRVILLSGRSSSMVKAWAREAGIEYLHESITDRLQCVRDAAQLHGLDLSQLVYIGSDLLDLPAMAACGVSAAPRDGAVLVRKKADIVLELPSGHGVLRELVERLVEAQDRTAEVLKAYFAQEGVKDDGGTVDALDRPEGGPLGKIGFRR
jgi:3-deoxy-D-manno-octulosonate 8-phosphate phosphatase (KDO 8-P phosphatase)